MSETLSIPVTDVAQVVGFTESKKQVGSIVPATADRHDIKGGFEVRSAGDEFMGIYTFAGAVARLREIGAELIQYTAHGDLKE